MLSLLALGIVTAAALAQTARIRTDVTLVHILATVKDQTGALVGSLKKDDFEIYDNGVRQDVAVFERQTEQPLSIVLMLDTSGSTGIELKYETDSSMRFFRALLSEGNPADAVALFEVNADVRMLRDFTHNYLLLEQQFKYLHPQGATALWNAVFLASRELEKRQGRKVIVLVTDGDDTYSKTTPQQALEAAHMADAVIYPVVVVPITNEAGRNIGGEHALIFLAQGTGGRTFMPSVGPDLDRAFAEIIDELRTEYSLAFYPRNTPPTKSRFHTLDVRVARPDLKVSARNGYYGDAGAEAGPEDPRVTVAPTNPGTAPPKAKKQ
jgi:Ca-activated chloride channel homolog